MPDRSRATAARLFAAALALTASQALAAPNILMVIADDMGVDMSPCHATGGDLPEMPVLSALCRDGVVFDAAHAAPTCSPTRAMLMTGLYPSQTGVGGAISPRSPAGLDDAVTSLFDRLSRSAPDRATALIGKWHLAADARDLDHPAALGVDDYFGPFSGALDDYWAWTAVDNGRTVPVTGYATTVLTDRAIDWIGAQDGPWFLWLAHVAPHTPFHVPPAGLHHSGDLPAGQGRGAAAAQYRAALEALDTELGRLLDSMDRATRDNTVVIFLGDNGTPGQVVGRGGPGAKGSIYPGGTHVPLVIAGAGVGRGVSAQPVAMTDLHATILDLAGVPGGWPDSARSLVPVLTGRGGSGRAAAYTEHFGATPPRGGGSYGWSVLTDRHALVAPEGGAPQLFDLIADPSLSRDLLAGGDAGARAIADRLTGLRAAILR